MVKHGVYIKEHKKFNHKTIYYNGHIMTTYSRIPKSISFKSKMVNDENQHFCGGWAWDNTTDEDLIQRIVNKLKPFGVMFFNLPDQQQFMRIINIGLRPDILLHLKPMLSKSCQLMVCQEGIMGELFNLQALQNDYADNGIKINIKSIANKELKNYFHGWDVEDVQPWETGLILGYPVENTISLYLEGRV